MQALRLKITLFFCWLSSAWAVAASVDRRAADSLFAAGNVVEAAARYEAALAAGAPATDALLLKLAYAYEQQGNVPRLLYCLQRYFDRHPAEAVFRKMNDIARANGLTGYETDDLNYFYLFYKQYSVYLLLLLLALGGYVFVVLLRKHLRRDPVPRRRQAVLLAYLVGLLLFVNLPEGYQSGITGQDRVFLRGAPSAAAPVEVVIGQGHKVNILGSEDIWLRVFWNNRLYYVRRDSVWII